MYNSSDNLQHIAKLMCNLTPILWQLNLILVLPFNVFQMYVLFDCIDPRKTTTITGKNVGLMLF